MQLRNISEVLKARFISNINSKSLLPEEVKLVVLGLSAGVDSVCLLDLFNSYLETSNRKIKVIIHHQDHQIREDSIRDLELARSLASEYGFKFEFSVDNIPELSSTLSQNEEELGREIRRSNWLRICENNSSENNLRDCRILTAHHANDQAETLLLNLSRGAGLNGLAGIPYTDGLFVRPLLNFSKDEIYNYAKFNNLLWHEDSTNTLSKNRRNYLRNKLIPNWEYSTDKGLIYRLSKAAEKLAVANDFIKAECNKWIKLILTGNPSKFTLQEYTFYSVNGFREVPTNLQIFLLSEILRQNGLLKDIYEINLQDIRNILLGDNGEKELSLSNKYTMVKNREFFYFYQGEEKYSQPNSRDNSKLQVFINSVETVDKTVEADKAGNIDFYSNSGTDFDLFQVRTFETDDYIINMGKRELLKDFFSRENVRLKLRKSILLIAKNSRVYVIGKNIIENLDNPFYFAGNTNDKSKREFKKTYNLAYMWYNP